MVIHSRLQLLLRMQEVNKNCVEINVGIFNSLNDRLTEPIGIVIKSEYIFHICVNADI